MKEWLRRICGAVGMGLVWGVVWAAVGAFIGLLDSSGSMDALWLGPAIGMQPGFLGGLMFSAALGIAAGWRGLGALPLSKVVACGAMAGLLVGAFPFVINEPPSEVPLSLVGAVVIGSMTFLGALSAAGSLAVARRARGARKLGAEGGI